MPHFEVDFDWSSEWDERLRKLSLENVVACTDALVKRDPGIGATVLNIGLGYAIFHGHQAAMTAVFGIGLDDANLSEELEVAERFYQTYDCPARIWTNNRTHPGFVRLLEERGYKPTESTWTWIRAARDPLSFEIPNNVSVGIVEPTNSVLWVNTVGSGFMEKTEPHDEELPKWLTDMFFCFGFSEGVKAFLAFEDGQPAGGGLLAEAYGIAILRTASTRFRHRGRNVQKSLIAARLAHAVNNGSEVCISYTSAKTDDVSAKNMGLFGFQKLRRSTLFEKPE